MTDTALLTAARAVCKLWTAKASTAALADAMRKLEAAVDAAEKGRK